MAKAAIVTTLRAPGISILSFLDYHFAIGFDYVFLFFDDPYDKDIELVNRYEKVIIVIRDSALQKKWQATNTFKNGSQFHRFIEKEVMARQILNVEVAVEMAREMKVDWLLHIDADELYYPGANTLKDHLDILDSQGVTSMAYMNHEAILEKPVVSDVFKEVQVFKKNLMILSRYQLTLLNKFNAENYFLYYANGKSFGKVSSTLYPDTVHRYKNHNEKYFVGSPCILHYPVPSFESFVKKYRMLGFFDDKWWGVWDINKMVPFHIAARNVVNKDNLDAIKNFYETKVLQKPDRIALFVKNDICVKISEPSDILYSLKNNKVCH